MRSKEMNHSTKTSVSARTAARAKRSQMICLLFIMAALCMAFSMNVYAAASSTFETKFNVIVDLAFMIVRVMGIVFAILGVMDLGPGISAHDSTQQLNGIKKIGGGVLMLMAPQIISLLK